MVGWLFFPIRDYLFRLIMMMMVDDDCFLRLQKKNHSDFEWILFVSKTTTTNNNKKIIFFLFSFNHIIWLYRDSIDLIDWFLISDISFDLITNKEKKIQIKSKKKTCWISIISIDISNDYYAHRQIRMFIIVRFGFWWFEDDSMVMIRKLNFSKFFFRRKKMKFFHEKRYILSTSKYPEKNWLRIRKKKIIIFD